PAGNPTHSAYPTRSIAGRLRITRLSLIVTAVSNGGSARPSIHASADAATRSMMLRAARAGTPSAPASATNRDPGTFPSRFPPIDNANVVSPYGYELGRS